MQGFNRFQLTLVAAICVAVAFFLIPQGGDYRDRIAYAGHGMLFDHGGEIVELTDEEAFIFHEQLYRDAMDVPPENPDDGLLEGIALGDELLRDPEITEADVLFLRALQVRMQVQMMSADLQEILGWRNDALQKTYMLAKEYQPKDGYTPMTMFLDRYWNQWISRPYEDECAANGVPVPPKFGAASGVWTKQGRPKHNILAPGRWLEVWTWSDPNLRGACVALTRSLPNGDPAATGIICQGAKSGKSCFWDGEDPVTKALIYWDRGSRDLTDIADGYQLTTCIGCHEGNDVYVVAPDDKVWCPLMRGGQLGKPGTTCAPMQGNPHGSFTLRVESAVNQIAEPNTTPVHMHSRHIPIGGWPPLMSWSNNAQPGCAGVCHVAPSAQVAKSPRTAVPKMPPNCHPGCTLP